MKRGNAPSLRTRLLAGMLVIAAMFAIGSVDLLAQCTAYLATNTAPCAVRIVVGPITSPTYYTVPSGGSAVIPIPLLGVANACGTISSLANTCTTPVLSEFGCCVLACVNPAACTITISSGPSPCGC